MTKPIAFIYTSLISVIFLCSCAGDAEDSIFVNEDSDIIYEDSTALFDFFNPIQEKNNIDKEELYWKTSGNVKEITEQLDTSNIFKRTVKFDDNGKIIENFFINPSGGEVTMENTKKNYSVENVMHTFGLKKEEHYNVDKVRYEYIYSLSDTTITKNMYEDDALTYKYIYTYNSKRQLVKSETEDFENHGLFNSVFSKTYDDMGNILSETNNLDNSITEYSYKYDEHNNWIEQNRVSITLLNDTLKYFGIRKYKYVN